MRLQQFISPIMAKGLEDTALYRFNRLLSLNEVGGEPNRIRPLTKRFPPVPAFVGKKIGTCP